MSSTTIFQSNTTADRLALSIYVANTWRLLPFVLVSALLHLLWVWVLPPMTSTSVAMTRQLMTIVKIAPRELEIRETPSAAEARASAKQAIRDTTDEPKPSPGIADAAPATAQSAAPRDFIMPRIDLGAVVRDAGALARETPMASPGTNSLNLTVSPMSSAIAGATRNEVWIESKTSAGWVMKNGKTTCIIAPHIIPHYMQGMLIVPQCTASK